MVPFFFFERSFIMDYFDPDFSGTDNYWKYPLGNFVYTDSVQHFCLEHGAFWILDVVGSWANKFKGYSFLVIYFDVENSKCHFYVREDSDTPDIIKQFISFTDLDVSIKLYFINGVLLFPSDY